jgi:hypothetical protein
MYERRNNRRYPAELTVKIDGEELGQCKAMSLDVSRCGMRLAADDSFVIGAPIEVGFRFDFDEDTRRYPATVVRAEPGEDYPFELAIEFDDEAPELEPLLQYV